MRRAMTIAASAALALAIGSSAATAKPELPKPNNVAAKICQAEKLADKAAFKNTYGKHAMRECKRLHRSEAGEIVKNAAQECRAERDADAALFAENYGTGDNAFGKCVSSKVKHSTDTEVGEFKNAVAECRAERRDDPDLFAENYGTRRNAFGKCVSTKVRESDEEPAPTT